MLRKWKKYGCILFLLIALPYVITIFINEGNGSIGTKRRKRPDDNHVAGCVWNGRLGKRDFNGYGYRDDQGAGGHCKDWHLQKDDRARGRKRTRLY